jgi:hypothetical protein
MGSNNALGQAARSIERDGGPLRSRIGFVVVAENQTKNKEESERRDHGAGIGVRSA